MDSIRIKVERLILIGLVPPFLIFYLSSTSGVLFFTVLALIWTSILFFLKHLGGFFPHFQAKRTGLSNLLLLVTSVMVALILIESFLWICQLKPQIPQRIAMPQEWKKRRVEISGASYAYYWHNILHVHDKNGMRRTTPFPPKSASQFRIIIVGDSLTYGYGVQEEETYPMQIEAALKTKFNVEVLNLGVTGCQSEDILKIVREYTPLLQPDLIIYGVCLNDFLPSGVREYKNDMAYKFPLPERMKTFLSERTSIGQLVSRVYNSILMEIGLRNDFWTDILKDFENYQTRFSKDAKTMNNLALSMGLPPIVAMVLNQDPDLNSKGYQIAMVAERHLTNAGMTVIPTEELYKKYDKQLMVVSPWEGHPNANAHTIFADFFVVYLQNRSDLRRHRITK
jgi:lysophospholipase L1-like esterase